MPAPGVAILIIEKFEMHTGKNFKINWLNVKLQSNRKSCVFRNTNDISP